jgi:hypothetical protein
MEAITRYYYLRHKSFERGEIPMTLFNYNRPVPCYQTGRIEIYRTELSVQARDLFQLAHERVPTEYADHCIICPGSFSIKAKNAIETSAKIVIFQRKVGRWMRGDPVWSDGVYIWIRANDESGQAFELAAQYPKFKHRWVLSRFISNRAVCIAPNFDEHFYYFRIEAHDERTQIAELLAFCCTLRREDYSFV